MKRKTDVLIIGGGPAGRTVVHALHAAKADLDVTLIDTVTGSSEVQDRYPMMDGVSPIKTKLVFDRTTRALVGGSVLRTGHCTAANVDLLSLAIQKAVTLDDLLVHQYATHPELAAKPSDNAFVFAARDALSKSTAPA